MRWNDDDGEYLAAMEIGSLDMGEGYSSGLRRRECDVCGRSIFFEPDEPYVAKPWCSTCQLEHGREYEPERGAA
jgi:hypothetical protein